MTGFLAEQRFAQVPTLVIGAGGLLGRAVVAAVRRDPNLIPVDAGPISWRSPESAREGLARAAELVTARKSPWQVIWCAGAGVNGTSKDQFEEEIALFRHFLSGLRGSSSVSEGTVFVASSAGGVFAGSRGAPFDENSATSPLSDYGETKLTMETIAGQFARESGARALIGRFSNLYGPGQNLAKQQGLISHLCVSAITRKPMSIFVPLDTIRDYLYVEDAARMVLDATRVVAAGTEPVVMKIFASQRGATIATLLKVVNGLAGVKPPIILGTSPLAAFQSRDLRLRSVVLPGVDERTLTPLAVGVSQTRLSLLDLYIRFGRASR